MANSFFMNGDKAYSENLNDGILVGNAFDLTVDVSLPDDTGAVFPNSSTVVKAKVADVSITPNSNLSIGSSIENSSGSSQVYRLTVYPDFNRFGGFKSITLEGDGTFYIANKGANTPIANNLDYDDLGNVPELKVLKEYDIVVTIPNGKSVSGLEFVFQSSIADVSGSINQSNVTGLGDRLTAIESKDTQQDGRLTALEEVDDGVFFYQVYASDYNPSIDSSVTVYCKCTDIAGAAVSGKSLTLYQNGTSVSSSITNNVGVASWTVNCDEWGLQDFRVANQRIQVNVTGFKKIAENTTYTLMVDETTRCCRIEAHRTNITILNGDNFSGYGDFVIPQKYYPKSNCYSLIMRNTTFLFWLWKNGSYGVTNLGNTVTGYNLAFQHEWHY